MTCLAVIVASLYLVTAIYSKDHTPYAHPMRCCLYSESVSANNRLLLIQVSCPQLPSLFPYCRIFLILPL